MDNQRNLILAIALSIGILLGWQVLFPPPEPAPVTPVTGEQADGTAGMVPPSGQSAAAVPPGSISAPVLGGTEAEVRSNTLAKAPRLRIESERLTGSISLKGSRIDDLILSTYREELAEDSDPITLFSPSGAPHAYFAEFGWVPVAGGGIRLPTAEDVWTTDRETLSPDSPVTLTWDNGHGVVFKRVISLDQQYMFHIRQTVTNNTDQPLSMAPYGLVSRHETPETTQFYILHEGLLGVFDGTLEEVDYDDLKEEKTKTLTSTGGWLGITDKYWLAAVIPDQTQPINGRFHYKTVGNGDRYQADFTGAVVTVQPGGEAVATSHLFAGAKEVELLDGYANDMGITNFDLAIDFGWFYFLTKPIFLALLFINKFVGNLGVAILLLTVCIKALFYPLANTSYRAMSKMKKLQPEMKKLQERFKDDKARLNQEMMALYKKEKANPAAGCLPMLVQIPVFFSLYKVLFVTIEMRQAPFFGWIQDLSVQDPTSLFNLFGLIPWDPPTFLIIGVWPLLMGITMYLQQKLNPAPADPIQAKIFMFLPFVFTIMLASFPAGLVIYWVWNNVLSIAQQWVIMRRMGVAP
ncbi:membrane protein insertase YidC [Magnetospira sp. QH-2]|uniref:membrane protein insertase YidC n=1 Tax=Magnetospira sp. (strain QH-2) TaxID=1288970 RepID=UPI0005FA20FD|nr:membrane protein insertase YidC [Magnetospira sp. QH-2]